MSSKILPAEWHYQKCIQMAWPNENTDWNDYLSEAIKCWTDTIYKITELGENVVLIACVPNEAKKHFSEETLKRVNIVKADINDTWTRDYGCISIVENGEIKRLDFQFNGWGDKFDARLDNATNAKIFSDCVKRNIVLEGGSIESDGKGTILTTKSCLLGPNRNGFKTCEEAEKMLKEELGAKRVLWLTEGFLTGDDTDGHIDMLARFAPDDTIVYVGKPESNLDEHYYAMIAMENELKHFTTEEGKPYRLLKLPFPSPVFYDGERLPASYANFLVINGAVLVPTYNQPENDKEALDVIQQAFPKHKVVPVDCSVLIRQHGSLHCSTMQHPQI